MAEMVYLKDVVTLQLHEDACVGCGTCLLVCPHGVLIPHNGRVAIGDRDRCMECGACAKNCPFQAIEVKAGVGCANAVINTALGRKSSSCCCVIEPDDVPESVPDGSCSRVNERVAGESP